MPKTINRRKTDRDFGNWLFQNPPQSVKIESKPSLYHPQFQVMELDESGITRTIGTIDVSKVQLFTDFKAAYEEILAKAVEWEDMMLASHPYFTDDFLVTIILHRPLT